MSKRGVSKDKSSDSIFESGWEVIVASVLVMLIVVGAGFWIVEKNLV